MKKTFPALLAVAAIAMAGCADMTMSETGKNTAIGAGLGAVVGAIAGDGKGALIGAGVGAAGGYAWSKYMEQKKQAMQQATVGTGVSVTQTADNRLKLNVPSDVSFDTGRSDIKPNLRPILDQFANGLSGQPNTEIIIVGHTDSTGSEAYNRQLSIDRAEATRSYLAQRGVDARRIAVEGRGEREPVADNGSDSGRARNRRVELFLGERAEVAGR